jgi:uncharacterized protein YkuJ
MLSVRLRDPSFVNFVPKTAEEAVERLTRCRRNGLHPYMVPECIIECSKALTDEQLDLFEEYVVNPQGVDTKNIVPFDRVRQDNEDEHKRLALLNEAERERLALLQENGSEVPPLPFEDDDEKLCEVDYGLREEELRRIDQLRQQERLRELELL